MVQKTIIVIDDDSDDIDVMEENLESDHPTSISICFNDPCEAIIFDKKTNTLTELYFH